MDITFLSMTNENDGGLRFRQFSPRESVATPLCNNLLDEPCDFGEIDPDNDFIHGQSFGFMMFSFGPRICVFDFVGLFDLGHISACYIPSFGYFAVSDGKEVNTNFWKFYDQYIGEWGLEKKFDNFTYGLTFKTSYSLIKDFIPIEIDCLSEQCPSDLFLQNTSIEFTIKRFL